jgi:hypothetical protein
MLYSPHFAVHTELIRYYQLPHQMPPFTFTLRRSDAPWSCTVELRFITDKKRQPLGQARNEPFGDTITDKSLVEDRIRRA